MEYSFFKSISLFSNALETTINKLIKSAKNFSHKKNQIILDNSKANTTFLYIIKGRSKTVTESADGEEVILDVLNEGDFCGEDFIFDPTFEGYFAQSITDIEFFTLPLQELQEIINSDHAVSISFLRATLQKQHKLSMDREHLSIQNAAQRIGCFILRNSKEAQHGVQSIRFELPYDKTLLASSLGMRAETFSRALAKLSRECSLSIKGQQIHIPELNKLVKYVCSHCSKKFPCNLDKVLI